MPINPALLGLQPRISEFEERKNAQSTGVPTMYGRIMQDRYDNRMMPALPGQHEREENAINDRYGSKRYGVRMVGSNEPLGNQVDVDTRFDPEQMSARTGNTLLQDAKAKNNPALAALQQYLVRGGR